MKMTSKLGAIILTGALATFTSEANSSAAIVLTALNGGDPIVVDTVPSSTTGPSNTGTSGEDGYYFFQSTGQGFPDVNSEPAYATVTTAADDHFVSGVYSTITLPSGAINTARNINAPGGDLIDIALSSAAPASFNIGILDDNINVSSGTLYTLTLYSDSSETTQLATLNLNSTVTTNIKTNDFYFANVQGAAGDYLVISGVQPAGGNGYGGANAAGVLFDTVSTPEPSTFALIFAGVGVLVLTARRKLLSPRL